MRFFLLGLFAIVSVLMADALYMYDFPNFKSGESEQGLVAHRENLNNHAKKTDFYISSELKSDKFLGIII